MGCVAAIEVGVVEVAPIGAAAAEVIAVEVVAIDDGPAVGDVGVVVVDHPMAMPVGSPVTPAPPKSSEEPDPEADSKSNPHSGEEDPWYGIPTWICNDWLAIHEPGIIGRHVDHLRVGRFDDDRVALSGDLLLFIAIQVAGLVSLLTQRLNGIRDILLLIGVGIAKR